MQDTDDKNIRKFATGATRDTANNKLDFEGFISPAVLEVFGEYMHRNRLQTDGSLRDSDNWQKGIPIPVYMKSAWRHFFHWWKLHRGLPCRDERGNEVTMRDAIGGLLFNVMGYLHEWLKKEAADSSCFGQRPAPPEPTPEPTPEHTYPRFFRHTGVRYPGVYAFAGPGRYDGIFWSSQTNTPAGWSGGAWSVDEMKPNDWAQENVPVEITREEALRLVPQLLTTAVPPEHPSASALSGVIVPPKFPRFFLSRTGALSVFIINGTGPYDGAAFFVGPKYAKDPWSFCSWSLKEMEAKGWGPGSNPEEISEACARNHAPKMFSTPLPAEHPAKGALEPLLEKSVAGEAKLDYPRFFQDHNSFYLLFSETVGIRWLSERGHWGCCNWSLEELRSMHCVELSEDEARCLAPGMFTYPVNATHPARDAWLDWDI